MHERCEKCGAKLVHGKCLNCNDLKVIEKGYLMVINKNDLKLYNKRFEMMEQNKDFIWSFLLGLMYASFSGHIIMGMVGSLIDVLLIWLFFKVLTDSLIVGVLIICFLIFRILCGFFLNIICIQIDQTKINGIKAKYKKDYKDVLKSHNPDGKVYLVSTLVIFVFFLCGLFWFNMA